MRKVVASVFLSLDGVMEAPSDWHLSYWNDELSEAVSSVMSSADAMLLGRITYQEFAPSWSSRTTSDDEGADFMNNTPKFIASSTLNKADWNNSTVLGGNLAEEINELKAQPGRNIVVMGGARLIQSLLAQALLDELQLLVHPILVGTGKRLFAAEGGRRRLTLVNSQTFSTGVLHLTYQPVSAEDSPQ
jgi:dihydrofolate reductase